MRNVRSCMAFFGCPVDDLTDEEIIARVSSVARLIGAAGVSTSDAARALGEYTLAVQQVTRVPPAPSMRLILSRDKEGKDVLASVDLTQGQRSAPIDPPFVLEAGVEYYVGYAGNMRRVVPLSRMKVDGLIV